MWGAHVETHVRTRAGLDVETHIQMHVETHVAMMWKHLHVET